MKVGIVAEGPADIAVIRNILKGKLGVEVKDTQTLRPKLNEDTTDLAERRAAPFRPQTPEEYSNWSLVLEECRARGKIEDFLLNPIAGERLVIVHIDTAEAHLPAYDIHRPDRKVPDYSDHLRALVAAKLDALLGPELVVGVRYAIAIEETDAWVLTIHEAQDDRDTGARLDPKKRLRFVLDGNASKGKTREKKSRDEERGTKKSEYELYAEWSIDFRERDQLEAYAERNRSLRLFVDSLTTPPG